MSPAARERFVADAREGDDGDGSLWSLGRFVSTAAAVLLLAAVAPPPSPTAEGGASPERARDKTVTHGSRRG